MKPTPPLLKTALVALIASPFVAILALTLVDPETQKGLLFLAAGLLLCGFGEKLNHPVQTGYTYTGKQSSQLQCFQHRQRNPCALGNLLFIAGMLLFFMGFARFISF